jgi:hypothetical protein
MRREPELYFLFSLYFDVSNSLAVDTRGGFIAITSQFRFRIHLLNMSKKSGGIEIEWSTSAFGLCQGGQIFSFLGPRIFFPLDPRVKKPLLG